MAVSALDVAAYILQKAGTMTTMKLQKLVYYCQAWHLVWEEEQLFTEKIKAWANGPVVPQLYQAHKGQFQIGELAAGDPSRLNESERESIDTVLEFYGTKTSQWLSDLTHQEAPWLDARAGLAPGERGESEITLDKMFEYYGSLY